MLRRKSQADFSELCSRGGRQRDMNTYDPAQSLLPLPEPMPDNRTFLNASVWFVDSDGYRAVFRWHEPLYRVALNDEVHLRQVAVALRQSQLATQEEICRAFGHTLSTQVRWERQYRKYGLEGLVSKKRTGRRPDLDKGQENFVRRWFHAGVSNRQMATRLGVGESTVRRTLKRLGLVRRQTTRQPLLPPWENSAPAAAVAERETLPDSAVVEEGGDMATGTCPPAGTAL